MIGMNHILRNLLVIIAILESSLFTLIFLFMTIIGTASPFPLWGELLLLASATLPLIGIFLVIKNYTTNKKTKYIFSTLLILIPILFFGFIYFMTLYIGI